MARIARIVLPHHPHLVTQRGNRREPVFFEEADYELYTELIFSAAEKAGCQIWAYCWMPNHTHSIIVPSDEDGLRKTYADAHRRYTRHINARLSVTGHLWQGRYGSAALNESSLIEAVRYVCLNPVRAGLVKHPKDWRWSSALKLLNRQNDGAFHASPILERIPDFDKFLTTTTNDKEAFCALRSSETTGRPVGNRDWIAGLEKQFGRTMLPAKRGPKPGKGKSSKGKLREGKTRAEKSNGGNLSQTKLNGHQSASNTPRKNQWSVW